MQANLAIVLSLAIMMPACAASNKSVEKAPAKSSAVARRSEDVRSGEQVYFSGGASPCRKDDKGASERSAKAWIPGEQFLWITRIFQNEDCNGDALDEIVLYFNAELGDEVSGTSGAREIDLTYERATMEVRNEQWAERYGNESYCGVDEYPVGEAVAVDSCFSDIAPIYTIVRVKANEIVFGDTTEEETNGEKPAKRPKGLNLEKMYRPYASIDDVFKGRVSTTAVSSQGGNDEAAGDAGASEPASNKNPLRDQGAKIYVGSCFQPDEVVTVRCTDYFASTEDEAEAARREMAHCEDYSDRWSTTQCVNQQAARYTQGCRRLAGTGLDEITQEWADASSRNDGCDNFDLEISVADSWR